MELLESDHVLSSFQIVGDAVGWGFVVRGSKPCHIQAVDPSGPAAAAGMKVGFQNGMISQGKLCCSVKVLGYLCLGRERCFCFQCWVPLSQFQAFVHSEFCCLSTPSCFFPSVVEILAVSFSQDSIILSKLLSWPFPFLRWVFIHMVGWFWWWWCSVFLIDFLFSWFF